MRGRFSKDFSRQNSSCIHFLPIHATSICIKATWLVGDHLPLRDFVPCVKIFMNLCVLLRLPRHGDHLLLRVLARDAK